MAPKKVKSVMNVCDSKEAWMEFYNDEENFMLNSTPPFASSRSRGPAPAVVRRRGNPLDAV